MAQGGKGGQKAVRLNFDRLVREGAVVQAGSTQTFKMAAMVNQAALPSRVPVTHVLKAYQPITPGEVERQIKLQTRWGVLGVIVQGWALMQMIKNGAIEPKKLLTDPRLYAMIAGPIGAIMEIMDVKVKARGAYKLLPNGKGLAPNLAFNSSLRTRWFIGGRLLGAVAGGVMAVMDINDSIKEYNKGNKILTTLLAVSGVVGFSILFFSMSLAFELVSAAEIVLLFSRILLGLFVLTLILGAVISYFKEKKLYDWLKQTAWGVEPKFTAIASAKYALDDALGNS